MGEAAERFVVEGLVEQTSAGPRLIGSRCRGCGTFYFPQKASCPNPACTDKAPVAALLPDQGTLYSYTLQRYQPPPLFRMDGWEPYLLGLVDLGEGLQVMGMLTGVKEQEVRIGMTLQLVTEPLYCDDDGTAVLTYKFTPAGTAL